MASPSAGLREKHKEGRRRRILQAAEALFSRLGFDQTSVEAIAEEAEVSIPTIYTYYASKGDLLLGLLDEDKRLMALSLDVILKTLPDDPLEAVLTILLSEVEEGLDIREKSLWREISAAAFRSPSKKREEYLRLQSMHLGPIEQLLARFQRDRIIADDLNIESVARLLYAISRNCFRLYLMQEAAKITDLRKMLREDVRTALSGLLVCK
jgi:AcrR family transcriptional regulator